MNKDIFSKPRICIVGMGVMGWQYAQVITSLPYADLGWICDSDDCKLQKAIPQFKVKGYRDFRDVPLEETDGVIIATPDNYHLEPVLFFARAGKHILVEKPLAISVKEAEQMVDVCKDEGVKLMVGHILRFDPRYVVIKERIEKGELGEIVHLYARRNNLLSNAKRIAGRTSPIFFLAIHDIDILCWLKKSVPKWVFATANSKLLSHLNTYDSAFILLEWEDGTIGCIETSWVIPDYSPSGLDCLLEVVGGKGVAYLRIDNQNLQIFKEVSEFPDTAYHLIIHKNAFGILRAEVEHFIDCLISGKEPIITGVEALMAVRVAEAAHRSIEKKARVIV